MNYCDLSKRCVKCDICNTASTQCIPRGSNNPMIYFVGEAPGFEEDKQGIPFVGKAGKYLYSIIDIFGLNDNNCRFFNVVRCLPITDDQQGFRAPNNSEINSCIGYLLEDISNTNPKVIILLGNTPLKSMFPDIRGGITQIRGSILNYNGIPVIPTFHPSYLIRNTNNSDLRLKFKQDISNAISICVNGVKKTETNSDTSSNKSKTVLCKSYEEFNKFCEDYIDNCQTIGYDVETNAKEVHSVEHRVVGFSIASSKDIGCYVPIKSLDFSLSIEDKKLIEDRMRNLLKKNTIVYNCQHEYPATLNWLDFEIPDIDDIFVMVKLMMGNADRYQGNGGLKAQSVEHLGYDDWSEDLDLYFSYLLNYEKNKDNMINLISKYYDYSEIDDIINLIENVVFNVIPTLPKSATISYEYVPYKLIGRYGSIDSSVLFELSDFYNDWMNKEGERLGIDLHKGYKYWMMHHYCGYILEKNGAYWNDNKAQEIEDWCINGMHDAVRNLVSSKLSEPYLRSKLYPKFLEHLKDNYTDKIFGDDYTPKRMYKSSIDVICNNKTAELKLRRMSLESKLDKQGRETHVYKLQMGNFETLSKEFIFKNGNLFDEFYTKYINNYINEDHSIDDYKKLMNPNATSSDYKEFISNLLLTPKIRYAKLYSNLSNITEEPNFDIDYYKDFYNEEGVIDNSYKFNYMFDISKFKQDNPNFKFVDNDDSRLLSLVYKLRVNDDISSSDKFDIFIKFIDNDRDIRNSNIKKAFNKALTYKLESLDAETMNDVYELYLMCHIDVEDSTTWNDEFEWLVNYKKFKKFSKLITTYINGKVGRNNVYYVNNSYREGTYFTKRGPLYDKSTKDNKCMLMQADFRVNMADTGRWQAGIHNLPAGEAIKGIYTSRFKGGCISMPDGSQMEVRTLAAECKDENLLKAFKDGVDIHRFFASKIYRVPYDEVQSWQRGLAKNAVFGMIYGESEKAFADIYLKGDLSQAKQIFSDMFTGFPKIKEYVERAQSQYEKFGKVTTITQRYLNLNDPRIDHNTMLRRSQNYPIQAAAEDLAGIIMFKLIEYIKDNNMKSKPFCFIHDSIEIDMHPDEVFQLVDKIKYLFNVFPLEEFGVPVACDVPLGPSMGQECEVIDMDHDENYNDVKITLKGYISDIDELISSWKQVYKLVEITNKFEDEEKYEYIPWSKIYLPKKAQISMYAGTNRLKGKREIHIIRK